MSAIDVGTVIGFCAVLLSLLALGASLVLQRSLAHWRARCLALEASLPALRREVQLMASISDSTGRQVKRIEHEYCAVVGRIDLVELRGPAQSLEDAIQCSVAR